MKKLLKTYSLNSDMQYFELIVESFVNGQFAQAQEQFKAMPKQYRKEFIKSALSNWSSNLPQHRLVQLIDLI